MNIPTYNRAKLLQIICNNKFVISVSGSHGKTTVTSLLGHILDKKGLNPIIISGGVMKNYNQNIHLTDSNFVVVEADESDGTVFKLSPNLLIYLNVDTEHLDYYKTMKNLETKIKKYLLKLNKAKSTIFLNGDDYYLRNFRGQNIINFGFNNNNNYIIKNLVTTSTSLKFKLFKNKNILSTINSNLLGQHNAYNVTACCCVLNHLNIKFTTNDFLSFKGIERRMNVLGSLRSTTFIDDYAHHPVEIEKLISVIDLFKQKNKFLIIEPHRLSRLNLLFDDYVRVMHNFKNILILPTYSAGESTKKTWLDSKDLVNKVNTTKYIKVIFLSNYDELFAFLDEQMNNFKSNLIIGAGAGTISKQLRVFYESRKIRN